MGWRTRLHGFDGGGGWRQRSDAEHRTCSFFRPWLQYAPPHPLISVMGKPAAVAQQPSAASVAAEPPASSLEAEAPTDAPALSTPRGKTLVQRALEESGAKKRASNHKRTLDQIITKVLYDNFRGWSSVQTDGVKVQGMTLRERLADDRRKAATVSCLGGLRRPCKFHRSGRSLMPRGACGQAHGRCRKLSDCYLISLVVLVDFLARDSSCASKLDVAINAWAWEAIEKPISSHTIVGINGSFEVDRRGRL